MAVTIIQNSCVAGAMAGLMEGRFKGSFTAADYASIANAARAIADEFVTEDAASGFPIADIDNADVGFIVQSVAHASLANSGATSITPGDYLSYAKQIYAASKQALTKLVPVAAVVPAVPLLTAGNFAVLAESGITNVPTSDIIGDMGVSPITDAAITGFALTVDGGGAFATSAQVTGDVFAANYVPPTPATLTQAVTDMQAAYTNAAGRAPNFIEFHAGLLNGETLVAGVYRWSTGVAISGPITLTGDASSVFIFQIAGVLSLAAAQSIILAGGVLPQNVFWQVAGNTAIGAAAHFEGIILCFTDITLGHLATMNGKCLAQTAVNFDADTLN
jgi:hypothetical protein